MNRPSKADIDRYLDEDSFTIGDAKYVAISFCASKTRQKLDIDGKVALKIRGAFSSVEDGVAHIKQLHAAKEPFDTYLCDMGKWTLIGNVEGLECSELYLVDMMKSICAKNADHKRAFEERKEAVKEQGLPQEDIKVQSPNRLKKEKEALSDIVPLSMDTAVEDTDTKASFSSVDSIKVPEMNVAIVSFMETDPERREVETPDGVVGIKFRGAFDTKKEAEAFLESTLSKIEREVDMYIVDMYKWLLLPPHVEDIKDVRYREDYLHELFSSYEESQKAAQLHHLEREASQSTPSDVMNNPANHPVEIMAESNVETTS